MEFDRKSRQTISSSKSSKSSAKSRASIQKAKSEHYAQLSQPKKLFGPPPASPKQYKALDELKPRLDSLAQPKERPIPRVRELGKINPEALVYEITEPIMKLATAIPKRYLEKIELIIPGQVKAAALRAKTSERLDKLAVPKARKETKQAADDEDDPWIISPNALKYKATARILELAKPLERD